MENWFKISLLLCAFGFLKEFRPSEVFVFDYLESTGLDLEDVNKYVWPVGTYLTPIVLLIVLLVTDLLRYKPLIVTCGVGGVAVFVVFVFWPTFELLLVAQPLYAIFVTTEVAYFTYIYAKVDKEHYLEVTSYTRAALFCGRFSCAVVAQMVVSFDLWSLRGLNIITLSSLSTATLWALFLPPVKTSLYAADTSGHQNEDPKSSNQFRNTLTIMRYQLKISFSNRHVLLWSIWYAIGLCGYFQVIYYVQMVWIAIDNRSESRWNGAVEAGATLFGTLTCLLVGRIPERLFKSSRIWWILVVVSIVQGGCIFALTNTTNRFISYAAFLIYFILHAFAITISSAEIAKHLPDDSYGLIFGINTFVAFTLQALLTLFVVSDTFGFGLNIRQQFNAYGGCYAAMGLLYLIPIMWKFIPLDQKIDNPSIT